jgi:hypothetical protein
VYVRPKQTPEYRCWSRMIQRCTNLKHSSYYNYGGRGITVCKRWLKFKNFIADMGIRPTPKHSIERKDNSKGYQPSNCKWATRFEQHRNMRRNRWITFQGKTLCLRDWEKLLGFGSMTIKSRLERGWSVEEALTLPPDKSESCARFHRAKQAARTHCIKGHKFTEVNTVYRSTRTGYHKICRTCENAYARERRKRVQIGNAVSVGHGRGQ